MISVPFAVRTDVVQFIVVVAVAVPPDFRLECLAHVPLTPSVTRVFVVGQQREVIVRHEVLDDAVERVVQAGAGRHPQEFILKIWSGWNIYTSSSVFTCFLEGHSMME